MDKHRAARTYGRLKKLKPWYLLAAFGFFLVVSVIALRENNLHMAYLREQVYTADKNDSDVNGALERLRDYVGHHMNTDLAAADNGVYPPIQLKYTYDRLITAKSKQTADNNAQIYTQAQKYCEAAVPNGFSGRYRISCIQQYVSSHGASPSYIPADLYKFDFYSPSWSPDLAGWSLVLAGLCLLAFLLLVSLRWIYGKLAHS